jgi:hypothetical protein
MRYAAAIGVFMLLGANVSQAQSIGDPLKVLKGIMGATEAPTPGAAAAPAAAGRTTAQVKAALEGLWGQSLADCKSEDADDGSILVEFIDGDYGSRDTFCEVPAPAYNAKGYSGKIECNNESSGVGAYTFEEKVELSPDGKSLTKTNLSVGGSEKYLKCPK